MQQASRILTPTPGGLIGLAGAACFISGVMAFWVYLIPLGKESGHTETTLAALVSYAIGLQIFGGLAASLLAPRLNALRVNIAVGVVCALAVYIASQTQVVLVLYAAVGVFAFLWMFTPAFHLPMIISLDPSRRSGMFISTAQLGGLSIGPMLSALWVSPGSFSAAGTVSIALLIVSSIIAIFATVRSSAEKAMGDKTSTSSNIA